MPQTRQRTTIRRGRRPLLAGIVAVALFCGLLSVGTQAAHATMVGVTRVEICKGGPVGGAFLFSVDGSSALVSVAVGTCKGVAVKPGSNTVKELPDTSGLTRLGKIQMTPPTAGVGNLATRTATVFVPSGNAVVVRFVNEPLTSLLKVCAIAGDPALVGDSFSFTESANGTTIGPVSAVAVPPGNTLNCTVVSTYTTGTAVNVAEPPNPSSVASSIQVSGGTLSNVNLSAGTATATLTSNVTQVIYTEVPCLPCGLPSYFEVCVTAGDSSVPPSPWTFTLATSSGASATELGSDGTPVGPVNVISGQCSGDIPVAAGQYIVTESFSPPDYVSAIATFPAADLLSSNLAKGTATFAAATGTATAAIFTNDTLGS
jgi:hypothetical protein